MKRKVITVAAVLLSVLLVAVGTVFLWPLDDSDLRPPARGLTFGDAVQEIATVAAAERADSGLRPECHSRALVHDDRPAARSVLMLHGYTDCPAQYAELADRFYALGYNVYVPLAPRHGTVDPLAHTSLTVTELTGYAGRSMDIVAALGAEAGVVGISGGGVLATWLTTTRTDQVSRLLVLSPFFRPSPDQAPSIAVKPLVVLFGFRVLPDHINGQNFSFAALAQYLRLALLTDEKTKSPGLRGVSVVTSPNDPLIDLARAREVPTELAEANGLDPGVLEIPAADGVGHDTVDPSGLGAAKDRLYKAYIDLYERTNQQR